MAKTVDREISTERGSAGFGVACRSLKRYKQSPPYRTHLCQTIQQAVRDAASATTEAAKREARLLKLECESELALLDGGDGPDVFGGLVHFERPLPE